jgi:hypothetical protein
VGIEHVLSFNAEAHAPPVPAQRMIDRNQCDASWARQQEASGGGLLLRKPGQSTRALAESIRQSCPMTGQWLLAKPAHPGSP